MQSGLSKRGRLFLDVQPSAFLPAAGRSWANIWVPLSSRPRARVEEQVRYPLQSHSRVGRAPLGCVASLCSPTSANTALEGHLPGLFSSLQSQFAWHIQSSAQLPTGQPSCCPTSGCSAAAPAHRSSSSLLFVRPGRNALLCQQDR